MARKDLIPVRSKEEAKIRGRNGGIRSGVVRRAKKNMRETAKMLLKMAVPNGTPQENLKRLGIERNDRNYQTAIVVRLIQKAVASADAQAIRLLCELTGELKSFGILDEDEVKTIESLPRQINIPANGRDKDDRWQLAPQPGPQTMFMASPADIIIYGGAAGGGKTFALLLECLRHKDVDTFGAVIFRKNYTQITSQGGLWDASHNIFDKVPGAVSRKTPRYQWVFNDKGKLSFAHIDGDEDLKAWQGSEIAYIGFDELTHFSKHEFFYMLSRNRSTCGVRPYLRATCNPDSESWVADFISWWINQETGYPIPERSGRIRWMLNLKDTIYWADTREELIEKHKCLETDLKSVTFISSRLQDNKILMEKDPGYLANLKALAEVDMERLLYGNWKIRPAAGMYFKRSQIEIISDVPKDIIYYCRAWDLAATDEKENGDADYTSSVLMGKRKNGQFVILDVINQRIKAGEVEKLVYNTSLLDRKKYGLSYIVHVPQDPGQAGKVLAQHYVKLLSGFNIKIEPVTGSKEVRATPCAAQWQNGNISLLLAEWNDIYLGQMEAFPESKHDDMVDATSDAFSELAKSKFSIDSLL